MSASTFEGHVVEARARRGGTVKVLVRCGIYIVGDQRDIQSNVTRIIAVKADVMSTSTLRDIQDMVVNHFDGMTQRGAGAGSSQERCAGHHRQRRACGSGVQAGNKHEELLHPSVVLGRLPMVEPSV